MQHETDDSLSDTPHVSVIMNCRNGAAFLEAAVESVLHQTHGDYEVVLWDNCSTDNSADIFRSFENPRFKYFRADEPALLGAARNFAASKARGEWLAFLDCDDLWMPRKLEQQMAAGSAPEIGLVYGYTEILVEDAARETDIAKTARIQNNLHTGYVRGALPFGDILVQLIQNNFVPLSSLCVRRTVFQRVGGFRPDLSCAEDFDLLLKVARVSLTGVVQDLCCLYRVHSSNASHGSAQRSIGETIDILSEYAVPGHSYTAVAARELRRHRARLILHESRRGDRAKLLCLLSPSLLPAATRLLVTNVASRAWFHVRWHVTC